MDKVISFLEYEGFNIFLKNNVTDEGFFPKIQFLENATEKCKPHSEEGVRKEKTVQIRSTGIARTLVS